MRHLDTPHVPHGWDARVLYEETTGTLLAGDLFTHLGDGPALVETDVVGPAVEAESMFRSMTLAPQTRPTLERLAGLEPTTLALMHGSSYRGDGAAMLGGLADALDDLHRRPVSVRLEPDEAWAVVEAAHTGILTTLRADGMPVALPVWFVVLDRTICLSAPIAHQEGGPARATTPGRRSSSSRASDGPSSRPCTSRGASRSSTTRRRSRRDRRRARGEVRRVPTAAEAMPTATREHYAGRTFLRFVPDARILSWDNRRLELGGS